MEVLKRFIDVYCTQHHNSQKKNMCDECGELFDYARTRLENCPHDPKPACKNCTTHCYKPEYREKIKDVMRFSGMYFVKRGRFDWLLKYFLV